MIFTADRYSENHHDKKQAFILWFEDVGMSDFALVVEKMLFEEKRSSR